VKSFTDRRPRWAYRHAGPHLFKTLFLAVESLLHLLQTLQLQKLLAALII